MPIRLHGFLSLFAPLQLETMQKQILATVSELDMNTPLYVCEVDKQWPGTGTVIAKVLSWTSKLEIAYHAKMPVFYTHLHPTFI